MNKEIDLLFKDFEKHFGFKTYEALKIFMNKMEMKIESLEESRDNWREKYELLKKETEKRNT